MIGGRDTIISAPLSLEVVEAVDEYICTELWPGATTELGDLHIREPGEIATERLKSVTAEVERHEIFYYESAQAMESWHERGRTDDNDDRMIHVIFETDQITVVTGFEDKSKAAAREIEKRVRRAAAIAARRAGEIG